MSDRETDAVARDEVPLPTKDEMVAMLTKQVDAIKRQITHQQDRRSRANVEIKRLKADLVPLERMLRAATGPKPRASTS